MKIREDWTQLFGGTGKIQIIKKPSSGQKKGNATIFANHTVVLNGSDIVVKTDDHFSIVNASRTEKIRKSRPVARDASGKDAQIGQDSINEFDKKVKQINESLQRIWNYDQVSKQMKVRSGGMLRNSSSVLLLVKTSDPNDQYRIDNGFQRYRARRSTRCEIAERLRLKWTNRKDALVVCSIPEIKSRGKGVQATTMLLYAKLKMMCKDIKTRAKSKRSKAKAAVVTTGTSKGNDDKRQASPCGLFDLTLASKTEECSPLDNFCAYVSSSSPEFRPPKIRRAKRRKTFQSPGSSESSSSVVPAVSRKKKRGRQKAKPPPAKPVLRSRPRRGGAAPMRHALRGARLESSETATSSGLGNGSSSRNWDGCDSVPEIASDPAIAMLQKEFSMIEKHELATETCRSQRARSADASNSSLPLLLLPGSGSSWATTCRKRREDGIAEGSSQSPPESRKRKRTAPQVESGNVVENVSGRYLASGRTPLAEAVLPRLGEHWSPNFASTPAPRHLQKEVVRGKKAFFLNLLDQSSRASLADVTNSILANDSFACITQHERVEMLRSRGGCDAPSKKDKDRNSELQDVTWNLHQKDVPPGKLTLLKGLRVTLVDLATESSEDGGCKPQEVSADLARQHSSKKIVLKDLRVNLTDILSQTQGTDSAILKLSCITSMAADSTGLQIVQADEQRRFSELSKDHVEESLKKPSLQNTRENKLPKAKIVSGPSSIAAASPLQKEASLFVRRSSFISRSSKTRASIPRKSILPPLAPDPFEMLLDICRQEEAFTFDQALNFKSLRSCRKIGEGLYGEVFRLQRGSETSVVKIVPVGGSVLVNTEQQKSVEQILPEVIISLDLSSLRNQASGASCRSFIELKRVHCVQDAYHPVLLKQWDLFDSRKGSENDRPDFYEASQMFVVFEFADGGESLECFKIRTAGEAESIFLQVACALAAAEVAREYEHRDLHWGNLLVTRTPEKHTSYRLPEGTFDLDTCGVCVSLIDYSLSRLRKGGTVIFTNLSEDASLFEGTGDHQFEVYRLMKQHNGYDVDPALLSIITEPMQNVL
ncbi:hypothetical protein HPB47_009901 [Ixodes persulcatus]|uniref:Uncharacterized protein n=1 Tax=Ixodes persulcatus TaxID=34615 RepID=A0AC60P0X3_IXOPE|nr:hypothetical protein HPB47_009901 [Ixodes persulcatus]